MSYMRSPVLLHGIDDFNQDVKYQRRIPMKLDDFIDLLTKKMNDCDGPIKLNSKNDTKKNDIRTLRKFWNYKRIIQEVCWSYMYQVDTVKSYEEFLDYVIEHKMIDNIYTTTQQLVYIFPESLSFSGEICDDFYLGLNRLEKMYDPLDQRDDDAVQHWHTCRIELQNDIFKRKYKIDKKLLNMVIHDKFDSMMLIATIVQCQDNTNELLDHINQLLDKSQKMKEWQIDAMFYDFKSIWYTKSACCDIKRVLSSPKTYEYVAIYSDKISNIIEFCLDVTKRFIEKYEKSKEKHINNNYFTIAIVKLMTIFVRDEIKISILKKVQITEMLESLNEIYPDYVR